MRVFALVLAASAASLATSLAVWTALPRIVDGAWLEVVEGRLVRTDADVSHVHAAVWTAMAACRTEESPDEAGYHERAAVWFSDPGVWSPSEERLSRLVRQQRDASGGLLRVEVLSGPDMLTLVLVEQQEGPPLAERIARELQAVGVRRR